MGDFEEALAEAETATELHFRFGEGQHLDARIARFRNLVELQLRDVPPDCVLPDELLGLPKLRELGISGENDKLVFPALVTKLPIERMTVWDATAADLPPLPNLERLELVTKDPAADVAVLAERFSHLVELRIWGSHLEKGEIPADIERFRRLEALELVSCGLSVLPDAIAKLDSLRRIQISSCPMPVFPEVLTRMPKLEGIEIGQHINGLPPSIAALVNLRELDLGSALNKGALLSRYDDVTKMKALPRVLGELVGLEKLVLDHCGVFELEPLRTLKKLRSLSISWSAITSVEVLAELPALEILSIEHADRVKDLSPLGKCKALRELDISNTKPKSLDFVRELPALKKLDISYVKAKRIDALYDIDVELEADDEIKERYTARASLRSMPPVTSIVEALAARDLATVERACDQLAMWAAAASSRDENALVGALGLKSVTDEDDEDDDDDDDDDDDEDDDDDDDDEGDEDSGAVQAGGYLPALDIALDRYMAQLSGGVLAKLFGVLFHRVEDNLPATLRVACELVSRDDDVAQCAMIDGFKAGLEYYDAGHREHDNTVHDVLLDEVFPLLGGPALARLLPWCAPDHLNPDGGDGMADLFIPALQRATGADFDAVIARLEKYISNMLEYRNGIERADAMWKTLAPLDDARIQDALAQLRARLDEKLAVQKRRDERNKRLEGEATAAAALLELAALSDEDHAECQGAMWSANEVPNLPPESRRALLVAWQRRDHGIGLGDAIVNFSTYVPIDELRVDLDALEQTGAERGALVRKAILHGIEKERGADVLAKLRAIAGDLDGMPPHVAASAEVRELIFGGAEHWEQEKFERGIAALDALPEYAPPTPGEDEGDDDRHSALASMVANCAGSDNELLQQLARNVHKLKLEGKSLERVLAQLVAVCMIENDPEGLHAILPLVPAEVTWDILAFNLACKYARESDRENTFKLTKRALELGKSPDQFFSDSDFEEFARDKEFVALLDAHR